MGPFQVCHGGLHHLRRLQNERKLHLPAPEQLADGLHAIQQDRIDDLERGIGLQCLVQVGLQPDAVAIDDALFQTVFDLRADRCRFLLCRRVRGVVRHELGQGIIDEPAGVRGLAHAGTSSNFRSSKMSCLQISLPRSSILYSGMIRAAWTMAMSNPASMA